MKISGVFSVEIGELPLSDLLDALFALERLGGDAGSEIGVEVSSFSSHRSDFGVIRPSQNGQSFNGPLAPFPGATSFSPVSHRGAGPIVPPGRNSAGVSVCRRSSFPRLTFSAQRKILRTTGRLSQ